MLKLGNQGMAAMYLGGRKITKAYLGEALVFGASAPPEPVRYTVTLSVDPQGGGTASGGGRPMRRVTITKAYRAPDWWLKWTDADGLLCVAFFSTCMGKALLSIDKKEFCGPQVSRVVHDLDTKDLLERGMVEKFTTAAERGAACGAV